MNTTQGAQPLILAIDTSCDDSSAAITQGRTVLSNVIASQDHQQYGGVFPTVAKQEHLKNTLPTVIEALKQAQVTFNDLTAIAVTQGPGLAPSLEVGINVAKKLAEEHNLPLIPVNHLEGHALSPLAEPDAEILNENLDSLRQTGQQTVDRYFAKPLEQLQFPVLALVFSGKTSEFILVEELGKYKRLGFTVDDAAGEALDKFGRELDLPYPAGVQIEKLAAEGNSHKYTFPLPMTTSGNYNLSFSGLKTSVKSTIKQLKLDHELTETDIKDLCASFQFAVFRAITYKLKKIQDEYHFATIFLGGGVAANMSLRQAITEATGLPLYVPYSKKLCVDNAAMIGIVGGYNFTRGKVLVGDQIPSIERLPTWSIDADSSPS